MRKRWWKRWKKCRRLRRLSQSLRNRSVSMYENILDRFVEGGGRKARHGKKWIVTPPFGNSTRERVAQLRDGIMDSATYETTVLREANDLVGGAKTIQTLQLCCVKGKVGAGPRREQRERRERNSQKGLDSGEQTRSRMAMYHLVLLLTAASLPLEPWAGVGITARSSEGSKCGAGGSEIPAVVDALTADENVRVSVNGSEERTGLALSCSLAVAERHGSMEMLLRLASTYLRLPATSVSSERPQLDAKDSMPACLRADPERASMPWKGPLGLNPWISMAVLGDLVYIYSAGAGCAQ